jgi:DAACS family dicarboxylate/amino acid:cation (Na+ or H+) symporter
MHLSITAQIGIFITSIVAGMGATGIPEGGLVTMIMVLRSANVPTSALVLLLPFDRILDRFRTMVNVWGSLVCTATVDHLSTAKQGRIIDASPVYASEKDDVALAQ